MDKSQAHVQNLSGNNPHRMNPNVEKGLVGAAVLAGLVLLLPVAKQSKEFVNCVKNAETGIINLAGVEFTDVEARVDSLSAQSLSTTATVVTWQNACNWLGSDGLDCSHYPSYSLR